MLENLRRKSLVNTYNDQVHFERGHAVYLDSFSIAEHKQRLSKKKVDKLFPSTFDGVSKEFRLISRTLGKVEFNMICCPKGTFEMGHAYEKDNQPREETIESPFLLGETEITQELYEKVMGKNPSGFKNPQNPVEMVSWENAILFCNTLSKLQGLDECYTKKSNAECDWLCDFSKNGYRLPTEKEWEYAAKAGTQNKWAGTNENDKVSEYAWTADNSEINGELQTHPIKQKKPNEWGFYDMNGNVNEWCWDKYDPSNPKLDANRTSRGGSYRTRSISHSSSAFRYHDPPSSCSRNLGFRVCRSIVN